jgi:putative membrane protein
MGDWSFDPGVILALMAAEVLYLRAVWVLRGRGVRVGAFQQVLWHLGIALWVAGLLSPLHALADEGLAFHMAQHLLIADLAAPLLLAGVRNPLLAFYLPRPALVALARRRRLRSAFRTLRRPLVAIPVYLLVLYGWHFEFAFEAAMASELVHALQHASFVAIGVLVWWAPLEPHRRRLSGELWKIGHILGVRMLGMFIGMAFVLIRVPVYVEAYGAGERAAGLSALHDQQLAGALMITVDIYLMVFALCFFFFRAARDAAAAEARERASRIPAA